MPVDNPSDNNNDKFPEASVPEAEVRLVVRFIVEEQIVYKGKVEKVNQLENEELSRIVSRIAWNGAKDEIANKSPERLTSPNDNQSISDTSEVIDSNKQDAVIENQSISDILNDCVRNVEIENKCIEDKIQGESRRVIDENIISTPIDVKDCFGSNVNSNVIIVDGPKQISNQDTIEVEELTIPYEPDNDTSSTKTIGTPVKNVNDPYQQEKTPYAFKHLVDVAIEKSSVNISHQKNKEPNHNNNNKRKGSQNLSSKRSRKDSQRDVKQINTKQHHSSTYKTTTIQHLNSNQQITATERDILATSTPPSSVSPQASSLHIHQNKIFAKWSDNHFYPGTIVRQAKGCKYVILFYDGAHRTVSEMDMIPIRNIEGKQVRVSIAKDYCVNAMVHDQRASNSDQPEFDVEYQQDGLVRKCVPLKDIFLTGEQGTPLINQVDKNTGASNFADVDLDNIIYEKRSRKQELEDYELAKNETTTCDTQSSTSTTGKRKSRCNQYSTRNANHSSNNTKTTTNSTTIYNDSPSSGNKKMTPQSDTRSNHGSEIASSPDTNKINSVGPNSNSASEGSSPLVTTIVSHDLELDQDEFYFASSSPHRTKTSLLL